MSFFGGNTSVSASTPAKPNFFSSFGTTATSSAAPAFGANTTTTTSNAFGQPSAFGGTGAFGTAAATSTPSLGGFGGFGTNTVTTSAPSLFGSNNAFGGFGTTTSSAAPAFGGFGTAPSSSTGFGGFGATSTTTTAPAIGGFGAAQPSTGFGGFGTSGAFAIGFGKPATATVTPGFGGFGGNTNFMMGQQQQQVPQMSPDEAFSQSIFNVLIYGDERDSIIAKWNYLQAMWGTGKSFYSQNAAPVDVTPQNYLCRFKSIGYSRLPGKDNKVGLVALNFCKPLKEVKANQQQILNALNNVFGNKPTIVVKIESNKELEDKKSQVVIYVDEKLQLSANEGKRVPASDIANYLNQPNVKQQLNNFGVVEIVALVLPDDDQLKEYLECPPKGIDARLWRQAIMDNPDPRTFIPVPMVGFNDLKWRINCQESETETHALYLKKVEKDLAELKLRHASATARIMEHKRKLAELSHVIIRIIVKQECTRKVGIALSAEEEALRTKLENMQALVSAPTQFKGRLTELLSQLRTQRNQYAITGVNEYTIDKESEDEMKSYLAMQQKALEVLADIVTKDLKALQVITEGMPDLMRG